ncbi:hypothetical protein [Pedobacter heparinus]|uniref:hypothetical protein n=1 Tax=Pedobacter heparinus TaxID=984 RepID=UPI00292D069E|nr:hypothetical protein [Pedobacter heparinus]
MKINFKTTMMIAALTVVTLGAFATKIVHMSGANENEYTWTRVGGETPPEETNPFVGTKTDAENYYGCSGTVDQCAVGTSTSLGVPPEVIYQH